MKREEQNKKIWLKPVISRLSIKKDTFSGSGYGGEKASKGGPPTKRG